ncbi:MAG: peptide-methionine (S)-S-oxide reductase MsrA [Bernardetiaceae bacterium]|nr:peptide-methionine (S)-S-oxide reductase MsrA [Bernardetiaceae bacterium]
MQNSENLSNLEIATLGAGCFWCVEAVYQEVEGVHKVVSGYTGGHVKNPAYREVCNGTTGHAEVVQVYFDPQVISFADILEVFWHTHNPTTLNQQGNDKGTQYRSAIFYQNEQQKKIAEKSLKETDASDLWADPIVTEISPLGVFYEAEDYHQDYFANNGNQPYCSFVINPKVQKFRKEFKHRLKKQTQD